tara:strand:- start:44 stop:1339 length:1296 start_codon:yes stop_codon:yes gene_type:complete
MQLIKNTELLKNTINWLFYLLPLSIILGNLIVNLNIVLFILFSIIFIIKNQIELKFDNSILLFLIFSVGLIISSFVNEQSLVKSLSYLRFIIFFYLGYVLGKEIFNIKKIFLIFSIILSILCLDLILQHVMNYNILGQKNSTNGATSFFFDERVAGSFVQNFGFFLVFMIFKLLKKKNIINLFIKGFLTSLISIALLVTFQRMPMVIWCTFLIFYGIIYYKTKLLSILISFLFLALFIFSNDWAKEKTTNSYGAFIDNVKVVFKQSYETYNINLDRNKLIKLKSDKKEVLQFMNNSGHGNLYGNALAIWKENKLFGIGYKNFYAKCIEKEFIKCSTHPHNYYLDILLSTGVVGLIIIFFFLISIFIRIVLLLKITIPENLDISFILILNFLMNFFPLKSSGSFFTTANSTYTILILILLLSLMSEIKKVKF